MRPEQGRAAVNGRLAPRRNRHAPASKAAVAGEVSRVNPAGRFVVLSFPSDQMPVMDQLLSIYRRGSKVAEVKVTGPSAATASWPIW